jgi:hypothetical protein
MIDPNTPASVKVRAAEVIVNHAAKEIEIEDIEARGSEWEGTTEESNSVKRSETTIMIDRNLTRRLEYLESRFEPPVGEPIIFNIQLSTRI